jgi:hypothetical protein
LEGNGSLEVDQLRVLFEELSMKSGEVIAALMSQSDEDVRFPHALLVEPCVDTINLAVDDAAGCACRLWS